MKKLRWRVEDAYSAEDMQIVAKAFEANTTLRAFKGFFIDPSGSADFRGLQLRSSTLIRWCAEDESDGLTQYWENEAPYSNFVNHGNKCCVARAHVVVLTLLALRKFRPSHLSHVLKDLVVLIAKHLWNTRIEAVTWWQTAITLGKVQ